MCKVTPESKTVCHKTSSRQSSCSCYLRFDPFFVSNNDLNLSDTYFHVSADVNSSTLPLTVNNYNYNNKPLLLLQLSVLRNQPSLSKLQKRNLLL